LDPIGFGVIGAGYWGPNLVRNIQGYPGSDLRVVCDVDMDRASHAVGPRSTIHVTDVVEDVLSDPAIEAIAIATPVSTHVDLALSCLEAGKHVLVEKPLALSVAEGEKLVAAAADANRVLMCDHTYCFTPAVRRIRELTHAGVLGEIQYFDSVRINLGLVRGDIDVFWDLAPHDLSILDFVLPEGSRPVAVSAHGADPLNAGHACIGYLTLPLSNGGIAHVHVNWLSPTKVRTTIVGGSKRSVLWDDVNPAQRLSLYDKGVDLNGSAHDRDVRREALVSYRSGDMIAPALPEEEALSGAIEEFVASIVEGRSPITDGSSGLRVLRTLEAAGRSLELGGAAVLLDWT
jgi:predicted dehydrogenase